jgi:N-acetylglucosamine-6-phosphate deacetylase
MRHSQREEETMTGMILKGGSIVTPKAVLQKDLLISDGLIHFMDGASGGGLPAGISPRSVKKAGVPVRDIQGKYVVPGFVDIHFHGYRLFEFTIGLYDPETAGFDSSREAYTRGFRMLRGLLPSFGVTGLYVGTFASDIENLERCFRHLREYLKESEKEISAGPGRGTRLHGGLLEGTFLNPAMSGAQNPELVFEPSIKTFDRIKDQGIIRLANVVPDSGKTSCELIRSLTERGVIVGAGHTDATADQVYDAVEAGLKYIIHFTNGPTGGSYKPFGGGGAVEGILSSDDLMVELICDGYHVNPA